MESTWQFLLIETLQLRFKFNNAVASKACSLCSLPPCNPQTGESTRRVCVATLTAMLPKRDDPIVPVRDVIKH